MEDFEHPQHRVWHQWKIKTPSVKNANGTSRNVSPAKAALNWQAENAVAQNQTMKKILKGQEEMSQKVDRRLATTENLIVEVKQRIQKLEKELYTIATTVKEFSVASQQIASKEAERRHLQNQLRLLEGSSSTSTPNPITSPTASSTSYIPRLSPESPFMAPKNTMQSIYVAPPSESFLSNLPMNLQPLPTLEYQPYRAQHPILLNQHLYDMFPKMYHHVIKPRYAQLEPEPPKPTPKPNPMVDPPDPTIGASSKLDMFPIDLAEQPNPISSFLKNLIIAPSLPTINVIDDPESPEDSKSDYSLEMMMHEPM